MLKLCRAYGLLTYETPALTDCLPMRCVRSPTAYLWVAGALRHCKSAAHRMLTAETPALCGGAWPSFTDCLPMSRLRFLHGIGAVSATSLSACKVSQGLTLLHTSAAARSLLNMLFNVERWNGFALLCWRAIVWLSTCVHVLSVWVLAAADGTHFFTLRTSSSSRARNSAAVVVGQFDLPR